jgi:photosystem II stability/assembly factor-like uncharacterized protein
MDCGLESRDADYFIGFDRHCEIKTPALETQHMIRTRPWLSFFLIGLSALCALAVANPVHAQSRSVPVSARQLSGLRWRLVGPIRGGRTIAVSGIAGDPNDFYFGSVAGGVWKTTDGGLQWKPLFDSQPVSSIGSMAVAPSDPNIIYVGTGEACIRGDISYGDGVYKSVDGGQTWTNIGLKDTRFIGRVIVDPQDPNRVFVAALGHAYGLNTERGLFRTNDGGKTWEKVLYKDEKTGAIDVAFDPNNAHILFASLWEAYRTPYSLVSGGSGSGIYRSNDGGTTWTHLEGHGLPEGVLGRIGVSVSGADANRVYAMIEAKDGGLYRSDDGGISWRRVNSDHGPRLRPWYESHVVADPKRADTVYVLSAQAYRSNDGGVRLDEVTVPLGDIHGLWIDPTNADRMIMASDGGVGISQDGGKTWSAHDNQPTAQFYHVAADNRFPYYLYGSQQDNTTVAIASRGDLGYIDKPEWYPVAGGESGFVVPYLPDPNIVYGSAFHSHGGGSVSRFDKRTGQALDISPVPIPPIGHAAVDLEHRFQWTSPLASSPIDPDTLYFGGEVLFKTTDRGMSWSIISSDLTRNDKSKQQSSGGPISQDNTSVEYYDTIFAIAPSPLEKELIWAGSDDGLVHLTRDGGQHWTNVTPKDMPEWSMVSIIDPSTHNAGSAYMAIDRHRLDDYRPYAYKTKDFGKTWTAISEGLPQDSYVHVVRQDPLRPNLLYAGTETGVWVSFDDGGQWQSLQLNLPTSPVYDLVVKGNDLAVATHGRGFWVLDDVSPLRQFDASITNAGFHLFKPAPAFRINPGEFYLPNQEFVGTNPPNGALIYYLLGAAPSGRMTLEITDQNGKLVRRFTNPKKTPVKPSEDVILPPLPPPQLPAAAGLNRFVWDVRYAPPNTVPGDVFLSGRPKGPLVTPGHYQLKLTVDGEPETVPIEINLDPRVQVGSTDLEQQLEFALEIRDLLSRASATILDTRDLRTQLEALQLRLGGDPKTRKVLVAAAELQKKSASVENALIQNNLKTLKDLIKFPIELSGQLAELESIVENADSSPTQQNVAAFKILGEKVNQQLAYWKQLVDKDLVELNQEMAKSGVSGVSIRPRQEKSEIDSKEPDGEESDPF